MPTMKYKNYTDKYLVQYIRKLEGLPEHAYRMSDADLIRCLRYHRARHTVFTPNVIDLLYKVAGKSNEQLDHRKYELIGMAIEQAGGHFTRDQMGKAWTHLKRHDIEITRNNLVARATQTRNQKLAQENERLERQRAFQALIAYADFTDDQLVRYIRGLQFLQQHTVTMSNEQIIRCVRYHRVRNQFFTPNVVFFLDKVANKSDDQMNFSKPELIRMANRILVQEHGRRLLTKDLVSAWNYLKRQRMEVSRANLVARAIEVQDEKRLRDHERRGRRSTSLIALFRRRSSQSQETGSRNRRSHDPYEEPLMTPRRH